MSMWGIGILPLIYYIT